LGAYGRGWRVSSARRVTHLQARYRSQRNAKVTGRSPSGRATHERSQSSLSSPAVGVPNAARGFCRYGHPNTPENTQRIGVAGVRCKECRRRISRECARRARASDPERVLANARRANATYRARKQNESAELLDYARRFARVLRRLKPNGKWSDGPAPWTISNQLVAARRRGLCESQNVSKFDYIVSNRWRITPLGLSALALAYELSSAQGTEARRAETGNTGSVHDGPVCKADAPNTPPASSIPIEGERE
jgi:hypothetical protein